LEEECSTATRTAFDKENEIRRVSTSGDDEMMLIGFKGSFVGEGGNLYNDVDVSVVTNMMESFICSE
jgi:hypothetical protein